MKKEPKLKVRKKISEKNETKPCKNSKGETFSSNRNSECLFHLPLLFITLVFHIGNSTFLKNLVYIDSANNYTTLR